MTVEMWITAAVLVGLVVVIAREIVAPATAVIGSLVLLILTGVVTPEAGFSGFSSTATITIAGLFVVARAIQDHLGLETRLRGLLGDGGRERASLLRLVLPVAAASSVIANTPLVAGLAPMVRRWADREGRAASRYLMPLSFAAIVGGVITTIGTSTTLLVSGLVERSTGEPFGFLEITPVGLPVALASALVLVLLAPRLLPDRVTAGGAVTAHEREYTFRLRVEPGSRVDGKTVEDAGLRNLEDVFLAEVDRDDHRIVPVGPREILHAGDELVFVGRVEHVQGLEAAYPGLVQAERAQQDRLDDTRTGLHEVVIGGNSRLLNRSLKDVAFRGRYSAAVLAIHRAGERVPDKLGQVKLQTGDSLLLEAGVGFADRWRDRSDFAVVVPLDDHLTEATRRAPVVALSTVALILLAAFGIVPTVVAVLFACSILVVTRTITFFQAKDALDIDILMIVAGAIGLGAAAEQSGLAGVLADRIVVVAASTGYVGAVAAILLGTLLLTEIVTNVAAAALMVPIALEVATRVDGDPRGLAVAVAIAASSSFLTPIGYQTNTIVYGLGGYRFTDYWRLGLPITLTVVAVSMAVIPMVWG